MKCLPNRGQIGIFNRSYYEEVLVVRTHPEFLAKQKLPAKLVGKKIWEERFEDIRNFEQYLARRRGGAKILPSRVEEGTETEVPRSHR
jgi:polyphosphate kinase 2 (PPK2 family)